VSEVKPGILVLLALTLGLGLLAFVVVTTTAFMKIAVVLLLVRNALGAQQVPPNIVLYGVALILTVYISAPIGDQVYRQLSDPAHQYRTFEDWTSAARRGLEPVRDHLKRFTTPEERQFFLTAAQRSGRRRCASARAPTI